MARGDRRADRLGARAPRLHDHTRRRAAFEDLVPADAGLPLGSQELDHAVDEPRLERVLVRKPDRPLARLALGARLPPVLRALVRAQVDVLPGEKLHHFREDALEEFERLLIARAEDVLEDAPRRLDLVWPAGAPQMRVGGEGGTGVAG